MQIMSQQLDKIKSYTNEDVDKVLQKIFNNTIEDRERAIEVYNLMKKKIDNKDPDELFVMNSIGSALDSIQKQNDILVKLVGVMQRLQTNTIAQLQKSSKMSSDEYNKLLVEMDELEKNNKLNEKNDSRT